MLRMILVFDLLFAFRGMLYDIKTPFGTENLFAFPEESKQTENKTTHWMNHQEFAM